MGLGTRIVHTLGYWLWEFPESEETSSARRLYRKAVHDNRNLTMVRGHAARRAKIVADTVTAAANEAICELNAVQRGKSVEQ